MSGEMKFVHMEKRACAVVTLKQPKKEKKFFKKIQKQLC